MAAPPPILRPYDAPVVPVHRGTSANRISAHLSDTTQPGGGSGAIVFTETHAATVIVPANNTLRVNLAGISFYFPAVASILGINARAIRPGQSLPYVTFAQGTGLRFGTTGFVGVDLQNDSNSANQVTIIVGGGVPNNSYDEFIDKRVIITNNPASNVLIETGPTVAYGYKTRDPAWADSLASLATQVLTDGYLSQDRKSAIFANDDAAIVLQVLDVNGNIIGDVQPSTSWTTDTGGTLKLYNPGGAPVTCHIGEVYYT